MADTDNFEDESFELDELKGSSSGGDFIFLPMVQVRRSADLKIKKYDFTNPIVLSESDLALLKTKSEQFVYY